MEDDLCLINIPNLLLSRCKPNQGNCKLLKPLLITSIILIVQRMKGNSLDCDFSFHLFTNRRPAEKCK